MHSILWIMSWNIKYLAIISRPLALIPQNTVYVKESFPTSFHSFIGNSICTEGHFYVQSTRFTYFPSYIVPILSKPYMTHLQQPHQAANRPVGRVSLCYVCPFSYWLTEDILVLTTVYLSSLWKAIKEISEEVKRKDTKQARDMWKKADPRSTRVIEGATRVIHDPWSMIHKSDQRSHIE